MTENEFNKLRGYYHSLVDIQRGLESSAPYTASGDRVIFHNHFDLIADELERVEADFPELLPPFSRQSFHIARNHYSHSALIAHLGMAIRRLKVAVDTQENTPVTETRDFSVVHNSDLRAILERDYTEIQHAYIAQCWKSVIIISDSAIETILLDCLQHNSGPARSASKAPNKPDLSKWDLSELINVCVELNLVSSGVEKLSHSVREYRNLVHPGNEIRNRLVFGQEESRIALEVLNIVHRDLKP